MKYTNLLSDAAVMAELGHRITETRLARQMTQAKLAEEAGVSKRTVERLEGGESTQLSNLIRCLRVLKKLEGFEHLLPEMRPNPAELLGRHGKSRLRARTSRNNSSAEPWTWDDEK